MKAAAFLEKATTSVFIGIALAAACSIGMGMLGGLFTLNEDSVLQGVSTMIIGVFIQAPIFAVLAGILTLLVLTATRFPIPSSAIDRMLPSSATCAAVKSPESASQTRSSLVPVTAAMRFPSADHCN